MGFSAILSSSTAAPPKQPTEEERIAEKPTTFASALLQKQNRDTLLVLLAFATILAVVPIVGLPVCEWLLRGWVADSSTRWTYSAVVAVILVNLIMAAYVLCCFMEGFPEQTG